MASDSGTEILEIVLKNLVPKFGNNALKHDWHQITSKLRIQNNTSFKKLCTQAEYIRHDLKFLKEEIGPHKLLLRFLETFEYSSNYWEPVRKIMPELRTHICKYGDTSSDVLECKHQVSSLDVIHETILENCLDDMLVVGIQLYSQIAEQIGIEKNPCPLVDMEMQTYKDSIEDLEEHEVSPEERKIFQQSYNKFNKFNKFKLRPRFPSRTKCHSDDADYYQMQEDKC